MVRKVERDVKGSKEFTETKVEACLERIDMELSNLVKFRSRDKSDNENQHKEAIEKLKTHTSTLFTHSDYLQSLAVITSHLIENLNMQMEAETADLLDRRMMQLFGVAHKNLDKKDCMNASKSFKDQVRTSPFGSDLERKINIDGIPDLGLASNKMPRIARNNKPEHARSSTKNPMNYDEGDEVHHTEQE